MPALLEERPYNGQMHSLQDCSTTCQALQVDQLVPEVFTKPLRKTVSGEDEEDLPRMQRQWIGTRSPWSFVQAAVR